MSNITAQINKYMAVLEALNNSELEHLYNIPKPEDENSYKLITQIHDVFTRDDREDLLWTFWTLSSLYKKLRLHSTKNRIQDIEENLRQIEEDISLNLHDTSIDPIQRDVRNVLLTSKKRTEQQRIGVLVRRQKRLHNTLTDLVIDKPSTIDLPVP